MTTGEWILAAVPWLLSAVVIGMRLWFSWRVRVHTRRYEELKRKVYYFDS